MAYGCRQPTKRSQFLADALLAASVIDDAYADSTASITWREMRVAKAVKLLRLAYEKHQRR